MLITNNYNKKNMAEKKGRFIIQEVKERSIPQISPKRYESFDINKKLTRKLLGCSQSNGEVIRSMSFVFDYANETWISIMQLWTNATMIYPSTVKFNFNKMRCRCFSKQPLKEKLFFSSNDNTEDINEVKWNKSMPSTLTIINNSQPFPAIEENETPNRSKEIGNGDENSQENENEIFKRNPRQLCLSNQMTIGLKMKSTTMIEVKSRIKKRKMTRTEEHAGLIKPNEENQKRISNQNLIQFISKNSFYNSLRSSLSITSYTFSLIQSNSNNNNNNNTFMNLVICPMNHMNE